MIGQKVATKRKLSKKIILISFRLVFENRFFNGELPLYPIVVSCSYHKFTLSFDRKANYLSKEHYNL